MNKDYKNFIIVALIVVISVLGYVIYDKSDDISELENKVEKYKENEIKLKDDKLFYKDLYKELAEEYNNRLEELGIDEYIYTDTSR